MHLESCFTSRLTLSFQLFNCLMPSAGHGHSKSADGLCIDWPSSVKTAFNEQVEVGELVICRRGSDRIMKLQPFFS